WLAERANAAAAWPHGASVALINGAAVDSMGDYTLGDLYFSSDRTTGTAAVYVAAKDGTGFKDPTKVEELGVADDPRLTRDALRIYFSRRTGGSGPSDIFSATRTSPGAQFTNVEALPTLASAMDDRPGWVSEDGCRLYIFSNRSGSAGGLD